MTMEDAENRGREDARNQLNSGEPLTPYDLADILYYGVAGKRQRELELRLLAENRSEFVRLIRAGILVARPEDFPEVPADAWHRGLVVVRGWRKDLGVGDKFCIDRENTATVFVVDSVDQAWEEDAENYDLPRKVTRYRVHEMQVNGDYAVLPGSTTPDLAEYLLRLKLDAVIEATRG